MTREVRRSLFPELSQFEVDFVIPRRGIDLPVGIDPFLLFKSRDPRLAEQHQRLLSAFNRGVQAAAAGDDTTAAYLLNFPEPAEVGFGYTRKGRGGTGFGKYLQQLIIETVAGSAELRQRGAVRHIEEMQLLSVGIGPDRVSDIAVNVLKDFLITYTQEQCRLHGLPMQPLVPVEHVLDHDTLQWRDDYYELPISPVDGRPVLFVPRRIVRSLPWINYEEFARTEFASVLRAKAVRGQLREGVSPKQEKPQIVEVSRREFERVDRYVRRKEERAADAQPTLEYLADDDECRESEALKQRLVEIPPGRKDAAAYQRLLLEILNFLFNPDLIDGLTEVRTVEGTERRDIVFTNDSDQTFWTYVRNEHSGIFLMFEVKNLDRLEPEHVNQTATYLGDRLGRLGFILTRHAPPEAIQKKLFSVYNDAAPRKIILVVTDADINLMLEMKCRGQSPMRHVQRIYRTFRTSVQ